ncbi:MAG: haloalkane dehalogenase [Desulfobacterales bacterium]
MSDNEIPTEFPFESKYIEIDGSKMHYIEEGSGDPILFLHGNPTSSYLWRNIIPHLVPLGRCIAPDLIGMGKSDKPDIEYRFFDHVKYLEGFIEKLELENLTLVIHDWGGALGYYYAMRHEDNVKGIAFMEAVFTKQWVVNSDQARDLFKAFRTPDVGWELIVEKNLFVEGVLPSSVLRGLTEAEMEVYREPFLDPASRKPIWRWPNELPIDGQPTDVFQAITEFNAWAQTSDTPKLLLYAEPGAIFPEQVVQWCRDNLKNLETVSIGPGSHFIQEDNPHLIGSETAKWYQRL